MSAAIVEVAKLEADQRLSSYSSRIRQGSAIDAEAASIDYQAWCTIAEWLESGRFASFHGGANPERADAPVVSWPELERAAEAALVSIAAKIARLEESAEAEPEKLGELRERRSCLFVIHRRIQQQRTGVDDLNRRLRARKAEKEAA